MKHRPQVALLIETSNGYARELLYGVRRYLGDHAPWSIHLAEHGRGEQPPAWLRSWRGDGIIARVENRPIADALLRARLPVVDVSAALDEPLFPRVATDSRAVTRLAASHLLERGLRNFGYCGDARFHWSRLRADYFCQEIEPTGFPVHCYAGPDASAGAVSWEDQLTDIAGWLRNLPKPVGILACYDIRGHQVLEACRRLGAMVPEEVAVIGVHNDELLCDLCDPPLSSVIPNARRAGYEAAALLEKMMRGRQVPVSFVAIPPIGVAARQSTDLAMVGDPQLAAAMRFILQNACRGIGVADVLKAVPMSRTVLERRFKKWFGRTPHNQILRNRIERAQVLLATTDLALTEVADQAGFQHPEYLSVAFKRATGVSPRVYRHQHQAGRL